LPLKSIENPQIWRALLNRIILTRLEDNWYDTRESLRALTDQQFEDLKLPKRLVQEIRSALGQQNEIPKQLDIQQPVAQQNAQPMPKEILKPIQPISNAEPMVTESSPSYQPTYVPVVDPEKLCTLFVGTLRSTLIELQEEAGAAFSECVKTLGTIVANIVNNTTDPTKRRLKAVNKAFFAKVGQFSMGNKVLKLCGFIKDSEGMILEDSKLNLNQLNLAFNILKDVYSQVEQIAQEVDPTSKSLLTSLKPKPPVVDPSYDPTAIEQAKERLLKEKLLLESQKVEDRKVVIFHRLKEPFIADKLINEEIVEEEDSAEGALSLLKSNEEHMKFQNRAKKELDNLKKRKVYSTVIIRVRFPNDIILQGSFSPMENMHSIYEFVR
jgi:hypothetical protein